MVQPQSDQEGLQGGGIDDDDRYEEIQYGICRSRQATSFQYQDSTLLSRALVMEQEVYYQCAEDALKRGIFVAHLLVLLLGTYNQLIATVVQWIGSIDSMTETIAAVHIQITNFKYMMEQLILFLT
jgi:hypothetical protein